MKLSVAFILASWTLLVGLAAIDEGLVSAQGPAQQSAAERCFEHHRFGAQPVDVAKTVDGQTVLAQTSWNWHDTIGCYLTLNQQALAALLAAPPPQDLPDAPNDASGRCFEHHSFGYSPVDVAKTADGQTVLARLSWGHHSTIGCYLVLDKTALATLRAAATEADDSTTDTETPDTDATEETTQEVPLSVRVSSESQPEVKAGRSFEVTVEFNRAVSGFDADDINVVNGDITRFSGSGSRYRATVTAAALGTVVVLIPKAAARDQHGRGNEPSQPFTGTARTQASTAAAIAAGSFHSCAVTGDQTVTCWGNNQYGQTDAPAGQYTAIDTGESHSCAITADRNVTCWGNNQHGQTDAPAGQYTAIATGTAHSCAINNDRAVACWGNNTFGQTNAPAGQYTAIATGGFHSCAIRVDQSTACWGDNFDGQTDAPAGQYTAIATGTAHSCAIRIDRTVACWGDNFDGQVDAPAGQYTAIATGDTHTCAIRTNQSIACWGNNRYGKTDAPPGQYAAIDTGQTHSCAIKVDQTMVCWGNDQGGQIDVPQSPFTALVPDDRFFDPWDRGAVSASTLAEFQRQEPDPGWTGDIDTCVAGTTTQQYRDSIFQRINWYRQMAGVYPVVENLEFSEFAQHAALIMVAGGGLSHSPDEDRPCYTQTGYIGASNSNLVASNLVTVAGVSSIDAYMRDSGSNNLEVGHRRWILRPNSVEFGTGDIPRSRNRRSANALYVVPVPASWDRSFETREERGFVAWPPPGYALHRVVWGRWSFSLANADFSNASVSVADIAGPVGAEIIARISGRASALVWAMDGDKNSYRHDQPTDGDHCYVVTITGVRIDDVAQVPYEYATCVIDPQK